MWTPADRALVGDFGSGQALTDDQFRLLEPLIPPAKPGGRPRTTDMRNLLDGLIYLARPHTYQALQDYPGGRHVSGDEAKALLGID